MPDPHLDTLRHQLDEALQEDPFDPEEVAILAGLLLRKSASDLRLDAALTRLSGTAVDWASSADDATEGVLHADADDDPDHAWAALSTLDEVSAGATFFGCPEAVAGPVDDAVRIIRAFAALWAPLATEATRLLETAPPVDHDPARRLWLAVEAAALDTGPHEAAQNVRLPSGLRTLLGLDTVIRLSDYASRVPLQAAASSLLPEDLVIDVIRRLGDTEILLRVESPTSMRLIATHPDATFHCNGTRVEPVPPDEPSTMEVPARAGVWEVRVGDDAVTFTLE